MKLEDIKPGYLCRIPGNAGWCRHGLYLIGSWNGTLRAVDTYWSDATDYLKVSDVADKLEFLLDLNNARPTHRDEYETFYEADRAWIPIGGDSEQFYVSAYAKPNPALVRKQLESKIADEETNIRISESSIAWYRQQLAELDATEATCP